MCSTSMSHLIRLYIACVVHENNKRVSILIPLRVRVPASVKKRGLPLLLLCPRTFALFFRFRTDLAYAVPPTSLTSSP